MKDISKDIECDFEEMMENEKSAFAIVYNDPEFKTGIKNVHFNVKNLLKLGWLLCLHE